MTILKSSHATYDKLYFRSRVTKLDVPINQLVAQACPPKDSTKKHILKDSRKPQLPAQIAWNVCEEPSLLNEHGTLFKPNFEFTSKHFVPLFAGSSISQVGREIVVPDPIYWQDYYEEYHAKEESGDWSQKLDVMTWRGSNTGGIHNASNWMRFHRHRYVLI